MTYNIDINTYDIDPGGHVNNIVYIRWLEDLRKKIFFDNFNFREIFKKGLYIVVISTSIKYKKQLKLFDSPSADVEMEKIKHGVITLKINFLCANQVYASAEQKCVIIDLKTSRMIKSCEMSELLAENISI